MLEAFLEVLDEIDRIESAGGLQWLMLLLYRVTNQERCQVITAKCLQLLSRIADELSQRTNPYHLILRSHFGLYGTPLEPELFDIEPPPPGKSSSTSVTYASVVTGNDTTGGGNNANGNGTEFYNVYSFNKENLDPKDVLTTTPESKIKLRHITPSRLFRGLLETEPLHFNCLTASDGTRLERADAGCGNVINFVPLTVTSSLPNNPIGTKKVDIDQFFEESLFMPASKYLKFGGSSNNVSVVSGTNSSQSSTNNNNASTNPLDSVYQMTIYTDNLKNEDFAKLSKYSTLFHNF